MGIVFEVHIFKNGCGKLSEWRMCDVDCSLTVLDESLLGILLVILSCTYQDDEKTETDASSKTLL